MTACTITGVLGTSSSCVEITSLAKIARTLYREFVQYAVCKDVPYAIILKTSVVFCRLC